MQKHRQQVDREVPAADGGDLSDLAGAAEEVEARCQRVFERLRDRQRAYYYRQLDRHFPGLKQRYIHKFGRDYFAPAGNYEELYELTRETARKLGLALKMPIFTPEKVRKDNPQMKLF